MKRRTSKAVLTRLGKTVAIQVSGNRPADEVKRALEKYETAFSELVSKHEEYTHEPSLMASLPRVSCSSVVEDLKY